MWTLSWPPLSSFCLWFNLKSVSHAKKTLEFFFFVYLLRLLDRGRMLHQSEIALTPFKSGLIYHCERSGTILFLFFSATIVTLRRQKTRMIKNS